ncbi:Transcriptional regulator, contains XRE-family HTH domain [Bryocella elongata]|uniref:Transcriptional regulator, contains XRE-family HTH domain n=1 Tax=Bryocella elongata TaxID=863522 RepID=A0A1H5ZF28_9BACT|nr:helix-turn-helix transcriptional regulator [Bryocella elongata]SEG34690.1 Transcriptional regulator, contains XRE-family HTH domain [Bryocella elongata]
MANMQTSVPMTVIANHAATPINIGQTIRNFRLQRSMSQGDIEKRTGLLRCYLSRVENGHTIPSLETLQKIASALDLPLSHFFAEETVRDVPGVSMSQEEIHFLTQVQRYSSSLTDSDRRLLLAMVKKFATTAAPAMS